jgi:hypothetical protein
MSNILLINASREMILFILLFGWLATAYGQIISRGRYTRVNLLDPVVAVEYYVPFLHGFLSQSWIIHH